MEKTTFSKNETYLPVTMLQFEDLVNEVLDAVNKVTAPNALNADYMAQILMSAIHALDHKHGIVKKSDLFESCINRISCHVTYHAVEEIQKKLKAEAGQTSLAAVPDEPIVN
jgi:hypothetical protein